MKRVTSHWSAYMCKEKEIIKSHAFWIQFNFPIRVQRWIRGLNRLFFCQVSEMDNHVMIVLGRLNWILFWVFIFHFLLVVRNILDSHWICRSHWWGFNKISSVQNVVILFSFILYEGFLCTNNTTLSMKKGNKTRLNF